MGSRIGRKFAGETYPISPGARGGSAAFARNSASGVAAFGGQAISTVAAPIQWAAIESGASPSANVPITPHVTGRIRITGMVTIANATGAAQHVDMQAQVDGGSPITFPLAQASVIANGFATVPFVLDLGSGTAPLSVGVAHTIALSIAASANGALSVTFSSSFMDIQEVSNPQ